MARAMPGRDPGPTVLHVSTLDPLLTGNLVPRGQGRLADGPPPLPRGKGPHVVLCRLVQRPLLVPRCRRALTGLTGTHPIFSCPTPGGDQQVVNRSLGNLQCQQLSCGPLASTFRSLSPWKRWRPAPLLLTQV